MTRTTEQERAEFEEWRIDEIRKHLPAQDNGDDYIRGVFLRWSKKHQIYQPHSEQIRWEAWQAARRAQVVPKGWKLVPVELLERIQESLGSFVSDQGWSQSDMDTADALGGLLAAAPQPPEAAPVPQFSRIAQKKLDYLLEAGEAITGYAIENKDGRRGAIDCHGFVYWWQDAAAPQPPEVAQSNSAEFDGVKTKVAPVQLPEPAEFQVRIRPTWDAKHNWTIWEKCTPEAAADYERTPLLHAWEYGVRKLYTEQQVRELLVQHGIK